ncbi:ribosome recycling factor [Haloimpatiens lingqiaonensis]|uniref:ribosome recycling factor n=1 Tax=Haloimpatiens lingqiaonensis TaxID=1380675 RepID=UPI0010FEBF59|nr:ribosome recycling factor [Haloimpatiens lingqiaonensis]
MGNELIKNLDEKMNKTVEALKRDLATLKAGRANPSMLDRISVEYYGTPTPLNQMANISAPEPRVLLIQPWDKNTMKDIEKAILMSDLGINPSNDGIVIRLMVPELTEETRKALVKTVKKMGEDSKIIIRNLRRDSNDKVKKMKKDIPEDEAKTLEEKIQKETDKFIKEIDNIIDKKEKDLMSL